MGTRRFRLLVVAITCLTLGACSDKAQTSDAGAGSRESALRTTLAGVRGQLQQSKAEAFRAQQEAKGLRAENTDLQADVQALTEELDQVRADLAIARLDADDWRGYAREFQRQLRNTDPLEDFGVDCLLDDEC